MKKLIAILLLIMLVLGLAACGGSTPSGNTDDTTKATGDSTEASTPSDEPFAYKHVVIVGIDGMGAYHKGTDTPNLDAIFADYALTDVAQTYRPVASGPCWLSMFTGVDPVVMRTPQNPYDGQTAVIQRYKDALAKYPTLFSMFHDKYPDSTVASISRWILLQDLFKESADYLYTAGTPKKWTTQEELDNALAYIETIDTSKNNFVYFYFTEPDSTGHVKEWGSPEYYEKLRECDAALGEIFKAVEAKGMLDDTLFIVTTDHGGEGTKHGDVYTPAVLTITLGFRGKTINNVKDFDMIFRDVAAIVAEAMELENDTWAGLAEPPKVPEGLFKK